MVCCSNVNRRNSIILFKFIVKNLEYISKIKFVYKHSEVGNDSDNINDKQERKRQYEEFRLDRIEKLQKIQALLLYVNEKSCEFKVLGVKISHGTLMNTVAVFIVAKLADVLSNVIW